VTVPTLVLHARDDRAAPFSEGRLLASLISGSEFAPLDSANHILLEHEPAWPAFLRHLDEFTADA
jgi:pimeloyl-ACP methyl ester carboxylesterase